MLHHLESSKSGAPIHSGSPSGDPVFHRQTIWVPWLSQSHSMTWCLDVETFHYHWVCVTRCLRVVWTQSSGLGLGSESGGRSMGGLGFSEWVTVLTLLLHPVFNYGQWARHKA